MLKYGQYCPMAKALELIGDRWTLLIIRDMLGGIKHFNDLERGLPGISRALLTARLKQLQHTGIIEKRYICTGRKTTEYHLTQAGEELLGVISELVLWGAKWAFGDPTPEDLNPILLMWWMKNGVNIGQLPEQRIVIQFNFHTEMLEAFWLILTANDVSICLTDPGYDIQVLVTAQLGVYFQLWAGRITYYEALTEYGIRVEGLPQFVRVFPSWFTWSHATEEVHNARTGQR